MSKHVQIFSIAMDAVILENRTSIAVCIYTSELVSIGDIQVLVGLLVSGSNFSRLCKVVFPKCPELILSWEWNDI